MSKNIFITLSTLFIISLSWHVSYPSNILVFGFMGLLIIFYSQNPFPLQSKTVYIITYAIFIYLLLSVVNLTLHEQIDIKRIDIFIQKLALSIMIFVFIILFYKDREEILFKSIEYALWIIVGLWIMQFVVYYSTGEYIDLLEPFGHRPQRYQAYFIINTSFPLDIIRPTSIYIEPGTYTVNTLPLLILSYLYRNRVTKLHIVSLITYFASLSLFGIIIAILYILIIGLRRFKFEVSKQNIFFVLLLFLILLGMNEYLYFRFVTEENTGALGLRESVFAYWSTLDGNSILWGVGNANTVFRQSAIVDDSGFLVKLFFEYGIFAIPFLAFAGYISRGLPFFFFLLILITKLHYLIYTFWFYLAVLYLYKEKELRL